MRLTHTSSENVCARTSELLNRRLAATIDSQGQLKQAHGKLREPAFIAVHESFDGVGREAERYSDLIAERTAGLGAVAERRSGSRPSELSLILFPADRRRKQQAVGIAAVLAAFWQPVGEATRQSAAIGNADTTDFSTETWPGVDDRLWFVEARTASI